MNKQSNIYAFLASRKIDYVNCPMPVLLDEITAYFRYIKKEKYFSDQLLLLSQSIEEQRSGLDALRINMKALDLISPPIISAGGPSDN